MTTTRSRPPLSRRRRKSRLNWTVVALLSLAVSGFSIYVYAAGNLETLNAEGAGLASTYVDTPLPVQIAFYGHVASASLALAVGPFSFVRAIRRRYLNLHRWIGRAYVVAIGLASTSGLVIAFFNSAAFVGFFGFGTLSVLWAWTTYRGYRAARQRDLASHQAWMIRSFALTFAAPTLRLWLGLLIGVQLLWGRGPTVGAEQIFNDAYAVVPFLCWLPNIVVAELIIRRRNLPGLRFWSPPTSDRVARPSLPGET